MIAITAVRATWAPNVGPTELTEKSARSTPNSPLRVSRTSATSLSVSVGIEIWKTYEPSSGSSTSWILASA